MPKETTKATKRAAADKAEKGSKKKATKKDTKGPKRPLSAYMFFSQDWRERVKAENPDASFGEIGKLLGARWKELDEEEKRPYLEQASKDKERADRDKKAFDAKKAADSGSGDGDEDDEE